MLNRKLKRPFGAIKIQYNGCLYHSLLKLKFILLIENKLLGYLGLIQPE